MSEGLLNYINDLITNKTIISSTFTIINYIIPKDNNDQEKEVEQEIKKRKLKENEYKISKMKDVEKWYFFIGPKYQKVVGREKDSMNKRHSILEYILREYFDFAFDGHDLYIKFETKYIIITEGLLEVILEKFYGLVNWALLNSDIKYIYERLQMTFDIRPGSMNNFDDNIIPFTNGYYNYQEKTFEKDLIILNTYNFPIEWTNELIDNNNCKPTEFIKFVDKFIPLEEERIKLLTYLAYCLTNSKKYQKCLTVVGPHKTGKSTLTDLLAMIFKDSYAQVSMQEFDERFSYADIDGKLLNVGSDISPKRLSDDSKFRKAVTDNFLPIEKKGQQRISKRSITKHLFTVNVLPPAPYDATNAFYRRFIIISTCKTLNDNEIDLELIKKIEAEIPSILKYLISFLPYLDILAKDEIENTRKYFKLYGSNVGKWLDQNCDLGPTYQIESHLAYNDYKNWCIINGEINQANESWFGRNLSDLGILNRDKSEKSGFDNSYKKIPYYIGFLLKKTNEDAVLPPQEIYNYKLPIVTILYIINKNITTKAMKNKEEIINLAINEGINKELVEVTLKFLNELQLISIKDDLFIEKLI